MQLFKQNVLSDKSGKSFVFSAKKMAVFAANREIPIVDFAFFAIAGGKTYRFCSNTTDERFVKKPKFALGVTFGSAGTMFFQKTPKKPVIQPEFAVLILYHHTSSHTADVIVYSQKRSICTKQRVITTAETSATALIMEEILHISERINCAAEKTPEAKSRNKLYEVPPVTITIGDIDTEEEEEENKDGIA